MRQVLIDALKRRDISEVLSLMKTSFFTEM